METSVKVGADFGAVTPNRRPPSPPVGPITRSSPAAAGIGGAVQYMPPLTRAGTGFELRPMMRNICPRFYVRGPRGAIPAQAPHVLKALVRQKSNTSRCQLRGGVHLEQDYCADLCLSARFNQCVFFEEGDA